MVPFNEGLELAFPSAQHTDSLEIWCPECPVLEYFEHRLQASPWQGAHRLRQFGNLAISLRAGRAIRAPRALRAPKNASEVHQGGLMALQPRGCSRRSKWCADLCRCPTIRSWGGVLANDRILPATSKHVGEATEARPSPAETDPPTGSGRFPYRSTMKATPPSG